MAAKKVYSKPAVQDLGAVESVVRQSNESLSADGGSTTLPGGGMLLNTLSV